MTSRERILAALGHREPDSVPVDLGGLGATGISAFTYNSLRERLGLAAEKFRIYDLDQMLACVGADVLRSVGGDAVYLTLPKGPCHEVTSWKDWAINDTLTVSVPEAFHPLKSADGGYEVCNAQGTAIWRMPPGGRYFDQVFYPFENKDSLEDLKEYRPRFVSGLELDMLEDRAKALRAQSDCAIVYHCGSSVFDCGKSLRGHADFMMDLIANKPFAQALIEKVLEFRLENMRRCLDRLGKYVDVVECSDDLGTQNAPMISPALYREMLMPAHRALFETIRGYGKFSVLHSCGSVYNLIPSFIESGLDALNPVQIAAAGMAPERLKREFGHDLAFWGGGCDTQRTLPAGKPEDVAAEVRKNVDIFSKGGGFIFSQVHNIQADVPVENILSMYSALGRTLPM